MSLLRTYFLSDCGYDLNAFHVPWINDCFSNKTIQHLYNIMIYPRRH